MAQARSKPAKKKASSARAVSGASLPCTALRSMLVPYLSHDLAVARHGILALDGHHDGRSRGHEADQVGEEGPLLVDGVERARLPVGHLHQAQPDDLQAGLLDHLDHATDGVFLDRIRLDDSERSLDGR